MKRRWPIGIVLVAALLVLTAEHAAAQTAAGITGVVRDTTGAVLPGVTVEASSPALIEKVRTAVTDDQGRFNIADLRPGLYTVTFTLPGFSTFRREGIDLSAGFTATANADLKVGGLEETVTVTGASPVVDIQNVRTQQVLRAEVLDALPSGARDLTQFASLTLGATASTPGRNDVGGAMAESNTGIAIHGGRGDDGRINYDGMNTNVFYSSGGGQQRIWKFNTVGVQETVVDTGLASAETDTGGANVNMIPRDGGNTFSVHSVLAYTNEHMSSGKVPDSLVARGSAAESDSLKKVWDYGIGVGGPIVRDRIWFYSATRFWGGQSYGANNYFNKSDVFYRYEPDLSRPAYSDFKQKDQGGRFTFQATQKHKFNTNLNWQRACGCWLGISLGQRSSPENVTSFEYGKGNGMWLSQTSWNYTATNQLLVQATASFLIQAVSFTNELRPDPDDVAIRELTTGYTWGALSGSTSNGYENPHPGDNFTQRAIVSYVTGSHQFKAGIQTLQGKYDTYGDAAPNGYNYTFRNGVPLSITQFASPFYNEVRVRSQGVFAQDQWTLDRLTLNLGFRYDHFTTYAPAVTVAAGPFRPEQSFPEAKDLPNYHDISPRIGVAWDIFGTGRTAIKGGWGRYLAGLGGGDAKSLSPSSAIFISTDRLWNDVNANFIPDCALTNFAANGECGAILNSAFGQSRPVTAWAEEARTGWGVREYSYQYAASLQHELREGLGLTVEYHRNDWRNQQAIINRAVTPSDFTSYCVTAPADTRLGRVSGQQVCGLYDVNPDKVGQVDAERVSWQDIPGTTGRPKELFNGVDFMLNARFGSGGLAMGGVTVGRTVFDLCWQNDLPHVLQTGITGGRGLGIESIPRSEGFCNVVPAWWDGVGSQVKFQVVYPLPSDFIVSGSYKNLPGLTTTAALNVPNTTVRAALGRDLSACRGAVNCTATASVELAPSPATSGNIAGSLYDERLNQVDLKLTRLFRIGGARIQGVAELYNAFNTRVAQAVVTTYGPAWQLPFAILGGRLFKFGAQIDF